MKTNMIKKLFPCTMILGLFALLLGVSSCRDAAIPEEKPSAGEPIRFDIGFAQGTRVTTETTTMPGGGFPSSWDEDDAIGIFAVRHASGSTGALEESDNYIDNVRLTYTIVEDEGSWELDEGESIFWPQNGDQLDFYAYYPYAADADPTAINFDVAANQTVGYEGSYLIMASAMNQTKDANTTSVPLTFSHKMVLVHVTLNNQNGLIGSDDDVTVTMNDVILNIAPFNLSSTDAPTASGDQDEIQMYRVGTETSPYVFRALVPAQEVASGTSMFEINISGARILNSEILTGAFSLAAGEYYVFNITLTEQR